ncbi:DUF1800 domain-containing protein [Candidatus Leptofilum sp.]|uniref:DUF1800 domain-containing protein n=1 Tax=Candidatus Leptofilum sp. TaxID=3241576 RepID=UPI003B5CCE1F
MRLTRRDFLRLGGLTAVAAGSAGCSVVGRELVQNELPETLVPPAAIPGTIPLTQAAPALPTLAVEPARRLLNRAGYGPRPGEVERVNQIGFAAYLEEQLNPDDIEDLAGSLIARHQTLYQMDASVLVGQEPQDAVLELIGGTFMRAIYSKRQLYEAMVEFWSDHFNIYLRKERLMPLAKIVDDRDVIRPYALGNFRDLLGASAKSPAMMIYLDNISNEKSHPNENYARELLELHTLGVTGGYTQQDVQEVARMLTGWTVARRGRLRGQFIFDEEIHDFGEKQVLGTTFPAGRGEADVEELLDLLALHPSTANFLATKLVRRFVADDPPAELVSQIADVFLQSGGEIKPMLRTLFLSEQFATAPAKLKRPHTYMVSVLRTLHVDFNLGRGRAIANWMQMMGQPLFQWPPPDGYPDISSAWTANLLPRWNFALALLHNQIPGATVPLEDIVAAGGAETAVDILQLFGGLVYGRSLREDELALFTDYVGSQPSNNREVRQRLRDCVALMLASPEFQWT